MTSNTTFHSAEAPDHFHHTNSSSIAIQHQNVAESTDTDMNIIEQDDMYDIVSDIDSEDNHLGDHDQAGLLLEAIEEEILRNFVIIQQEVQFRIERGNIKAIFYHKLFQEMYSQRKKIVCRLDEISENIEKIEETERECKREENSEIMEDLNRLKIRQNKLRCRMLSFLEEIDGDKKNAEVEYEQTRIHIENLRATCVYTEDFVDN